MGLPSPALTRDRTDHCSFSALRLPPASIPKGQDLGDYQGLRKICLPQSRIATEILLRRSWPSKPYYACTRARTHTHTSPFSISQSSHPSWGKQLTLAKNNFCTQSLNMGALPSDKSFHFKAKGGEKHRKWSILALAVYIGVFVVTCNINCQLDQLF